MRVELRGLTYRAPTLPIADTNLLTFILTASDGHPNSSVTNLVLVDLYSQLTPPGLSGMESGQVVNDNTTLAAFSRVSIQSGNGTAITVRVQLSGVTNDNQGQLINLGDFTRLTSLTAASIYEFTGTSEAATTGIRALFFQPTPNRIAGTLPLGQLNLTTEVENYPGFPAGNLTQFLETSINDEQRGMMPPHSGHGVSGPELMELMRQQAKNFGTRIITDDITRVEFAKHPFVLYPSQGEPVEAQTVIVATGARANYLGLPSEEMYKNRGVSACAK